MLGMSRQTRVLRACDSCTRSKQRCDGQRPCRRCAERKDLCHYTKAVRKRGRRPRSDSNRMSIHDTSVQHEAIQAQEGSPHDTPTSNSLPSHAEGDSHATGPAASRSPKMQEAVNGSVDRRQPSMTAGSSLMDPKTSMDEFFQTAMNGPSLDSRSGVTPGRVQHWLEKTTPIGPRGSLSGVNQDFDGGMSNIPVKSPYRCLEPVLPHLRGILSAEEASEMLEIYFHEQRSTSLFKSTSPYALAHVLHPSSVLHPTDPRPTSPTLLVVILFCVAQTADMKIFDPPGARERIIVELYRLSLDLFQADDPDNYFRTSDGWQFYPSGGTTHNSRSTPGRQSADKGLLPKPLGSTDTILAVAILTVVISGGHYKADSLKWLNKLFRLVRASGLDMEDQDIDLGPVFRGLYNGDSTFRRWLVAKEERRRLFWLVYSLDRHLALSFNLSLGLPDGTFCVRAPLPEHLWQTLDTADVNCIPACPLGPPTSVTGSGFFEYFLPLASVLGNIIDMHHYRNHPTLGEHVPREAIRRIEDMISQREQELADLDGHTDSFLPESAVDSFVQQQSHGRQPHGPNAFISPTAGPSSPVSKLSMVKAYSTYLLHVFYILLHGKWDPISMIEDKDDWITSERFLTCASHALSATGVVSEILTIDPELTFMPYVFGIYLLQGSFILLLFVDRMPELGPNRPVEEVCETIIRAHEVSVVTLDTTFQKNFRKVFRSMLYDAQQVGLHSWDEHKARRRELLSLYRWTPLAHGLAY